MISSSSNNICMHHRGPGRSAPPSSATTTTTTIITSSIVIRSCPYIITIYIYVVITCITSGIEDLAAPLRFRALRRVANRWPENSMFMIVVDVYHVCMYVCMYINIYIYIYQPFCVRSGFRSTQFTQARAWFRSPDIEIHTHIYIYI